MFADGNGCLSLQLFDEFPDLPDAPDAIITSAEITMVGCGFPLEEPIPTMSEWGLIILGLMLVITLSNWPFWIPLCEEATAADEIKFLVKGI